MTVLQRLYHCMKRGNWLSTTLNEKGNDGREDLTRNIAGLLHMTKVIENDNEATVESRKLLPKYRGPYIVKRVIENDQ